MREEPKKDRRVEGQVEILCRGETLRLLSEKAVYWREEGVLLVADLHLGKTATFRSAGLAVPEGDGAEDLARLGCLVDATGAGEVIVLGDLLHARSGRTGAVRGTFAEWRAGRKDLRITLVMGNHDHSAGPPPEEWGIEVWPDSVERGPFSFVHDARPAEGCYAMGGHLHPAVSISDGRRGRFRLPCFHFGGNHAVLPAFGSFTGTHVLRGDVDGRIFAIADERIFEIPPEWRGRPPIGKMPRPPAGKKTG